MNSIFPILIFLGVITTSFAQNYQLIIPNQTAHFIHQTEILSIRIDSIKITGGLSHYYNHKVLSKQTTNTPPCLLLETDSSWIGHQIDVSSNGIYTFFNRQNEPISINTKASLNDNWPLYTWSNNNFISATTLSFSTFTKGTRSLGS